MDLHSNSHPELGKLEQIVSQFLLKSLHIILHSRIPSLCPRDHSGNISSVSRVRRSDKWFNLILGDRPAALDNLNFWHRDLMGPMVIDVILVHEEPTSSVETVIERWVVQFEAPQAGESSAHHTTYKKSIVLLRSLYSHMRLLPAYRVFRQMSSSSQSQTYNFDIIYKVSSIHYPFSRKEEEVMKRYSFAPVEAHPGHLNISVTYLPTLSEFNLKPLTSLVPEIITDYVGSPTTDPMRYFSSEKGVRATSFVNRVRPPSHSPSERPHSWSSGFHRAAAAQNQTLGVTKRVQILRPPHQKALNYDEYQLSPPFSSSPSPSPPTYISGGYPMRSETAPVAIPLPLTGRSSRNLSANFSDPNRHSLPPLSPSCTKHDPSLQESPSGIRSLRKMGGLRSGELHSGITNNYPAQKLVRDSGEDSGRFSGLLSSSGSPHISFSRRYDTRLSFQDDMDDCDFSCPFDVDDMDDPQVSGNPDGRKPSELTSLPFPISKKSQDAAVGVLVQMLRAAPPLRQDSSCYSTRSMKAGAQVDLGTASGYFMPRKATDALEELRSYREMKDLLLSKSGNTNVW